MGQTSNMDDMGQVYQWDERDLVVGEHSTFYLENSWDKGNPELFNTNAIKNLHILWKYERHLVREAQESSIIHSLFYFENNSVISPGKSS